MKHLYRSAAVLACALLASAGASAAQRAAFVTPKDCDTLLRTYTTFTDRANLPENADSQGARFLAQELRAAYQGAGCPPDRLVAVWMYFYDQAPWPWSGEPWIDSYQQQKNHQKTKR